MRGQIFKTFWQFSSDLQKFEMFEFFLVIQFCVDTINLAEQKRLNI